MTKTQIISELKSDADFYGFHLPKDLDKKKKAELEVLYEECRQSVDDYIAYKNGVQVW